MKKTEPSLIITPEYRQFIEELKDRVVSARISAARAITHEAILLYWDIGRRIFEKQQVIGWGESVIDQVSKDLQASFPGATGYSSRNLRDMKRFYLAYADSSIWRQLVAKSDQSSGGAGIVMPTAVGGEADAVTEILRQIVAEIPWGQNLLILNKLTEPAARLWYLRATAQFGWSRNVLNRFLKALVAFDLKVGSFEPEHAGKMDFYLNLLNDKERGPDDQPSIGIILCAEKDDVDIEYALRTKDNPIGVAAYELQSRLPGSLKGKLPTAKQLEDVVRDEMG